MTTKSKVAISRLVIRAVTGWITKGNRTTTVLKPTDGGSPGYIMERKTTAIVDDYSSDSAGVVIVVATLLKRLLRVLDGTAWDIRATLTVLDVDFFIVLHRKRSAASHSKGHIPAGGTGVFGQPFIIGMGVIDETTIGNIIHGETTLTPHGDDAMSISNVIKRCFNLKLNE